MSLPEKSEIANKLSDLLSNRLSRIEAAEWARKIAEPFPMHIADFKDNALNEAFLSIQIAGAQLGKISEQFFPDNEEYFVRESDFSYWLKILKDIFEPQSPKIDRLQDIDIHEHRNIGDFYDLIWNISYDEFTNLTGLLTHASHSDLYYERYVYFIVDQTYHVMIIWDMAYGVKRGVVYSSSGNSITTVQILQSAFGNEIQLSDKTTHH